MEATVTVQQVNNIMIYFILFILICINSYLIYEIINIKKELLNNKSYIEYKFNKIDTSMYSKFNIIREKINNTEETVDKILKVSYCINNKLSNRKKIKK